MDYTKKRYYLFLFIVLVFIAFNVIYDANRKNVAMFLKKQTSEMLLKYETVYSYNVNLADLIFETHIDTLKVKELFRDREREKLYQHLLKNYEIFKNYSVRQLHFHLPNSKSFLRMHRPKKFGDDLSQVRPTVYFVNKNRKRIDGFEEGRIYNGFRFVYPLFDVDNYIGSVEISFSALSFVKDISKHYKIKTNFLIDKRVVDEKVFKSERFNYIQSPISQYYFEKSVLDHLKVDFSKKRLSKVQEETLYKNINRGKAFSKFDAYFKEIVTFIPMKNPITGKITAVFAFRSSDIFVRKANNHALMLSIISVIIIGLVLLLIYKEIQNKESLRRKIQDSTQELKALNRQLAEMAHVDSLTGANNRRYLYEVAKKLIPFVKREEQNLSVAMIDLDHFKDVNDTYGHDVGDEVLKVFVEYVKSNIRESDIFVRYGGEEFVLLLPNTDLEHAKVLTEKLRSSIENCKKIDKVRFTISIGVAAFIISEDTIDTIIKKADEALYEAKDSGRNRVVSKS